MSCFISLLRYPIYTIITVWIVIATLASSWKIFCCLFAYTECHTYIMYFCETWKYLIFVKLENSTKSLILIKPFSFYRSLVVVSLEEQLRSFTTFLIQLRNFQNLKLDFSCYRTISLSWMWARENAVIIFLIAVGFCFFTAAKEVPYDVGRKCVLYDPYYNFVSDLFTIPLITGVYSFI